VTKEHDLIVLRLVYESGNHEMHASDIAPHLSYTGHAPVNSQIARFSKRVVEKTGVRPPVREDGSTRWWHVPFLGYDKKDGMCAWIMRPELVAACEQVFGQGDSEFI
jgi:5-methylcytosine-specific restriction protein A